MCTVKKVTVVPYKAKAMSRMAQGVHVRTDYKGRGNLYIPFLSYAIGVQTWHGKTVPFQWPYCDLGGNKTGISPPSCITQVKLHKKR